MAFTAGGKIRAADLNRLGALVGRNQRTTNSGPITAITRVLSTSAPVVAGRTYRVTCYGELFGDSGAATTTHLHLHDWRDLDNLLILLLGITIQKAQSCSGRHIRKRAPSPCSLTRAFRAVLPARSTRSRSASS